jgi:hypothetical protein
MFTPIILKIKTEKITIKSPAMDDVSNSLPACNRSGSPEDMAIWREATIMKNMAIAPPTPIAHFRKNEVVSVIEVKGIHPIAVLKARFPGQKPSKSKRGRTPESSTHLFVAVSHLTLLPGQLSL